MESEKDQEFEKSAKKPNSGSTRREDTKAGYDRLEPKPEVPPKNSSFMRLVKRVGYSVWLIVMVVGGALAFITALFLI